MFVSWHCLLSCYILPTPSLSELPHPVCLSLFTTLFLLPPPPAPPSYLNFFFQSLLLHNISYSLHNHISLGHYIKYGILNFFITTINILHLYRFITHLNINIKINTWNIWSWHLLLLSFKIDNFIDIGSPQNSDEIKNNLIIITVWIVI